MAAGGNLLAGSVRSALALAHRRATRAPPAVPRLARAEPGARTPSALWLSLYALSGFVALSLEMLWFR